MRKKHHYRINAKNRAYDRFYIINYLEPQRDWKSIQMEEEHDDESDDQLSDEEKGEWYLSDDEDQLASPTMCLFCNTCLDSASDAFSHCASMHSFDLERLKQEWGWYYN